METQGEQTKTQKETRHIIGNNGEHKKTRCRFTQGRFERTHGGVLDGNTAGRVKREGGRRHFRLPKFAHVGLSLASEAHQKNPLDLTHIQFENKSRTTRSRFLQSFALPDKAVELQLIPRETLERTGCEMVRFVFRPFSKHKKRFARRYRNEPSPEFSLTLPDLLSGPPFGC